MPPNKRFTIKVIPPEEKIIVVDAPTLEHATKLARMEWIEFVEDDFHRRAQTIEIEEIDGEGM